jgi:hypothetical protein
LAACAASVPIHITELPPGTEEAPTPRPVRPILKEAGLPDEWDFLKPDMSTTDRNAGPAIAFPGNGGDIP